MTGNDNTIYLPYKVEIVAITFSCVIWNKLENPCEVDITVVADHQT